MKLLMDYQVEKKSTCVQLTFLVTLNKHRRMGCVKGDSILLQVGGYRNAAGEESGKQARSGLR